MSVTNTDGGRAPLLLPAIAVCIGMGGSSLSGSSEHFHIALVIALVVAPILWWAASRIVHTPEFVSGGVTLLLIVASSWSFHHMSVLMLPRDDLAVAPPSGEVAVVGKVASYKVKTRTGGYVDVDVSGVETSQGLIQSRKGCVRVSLGEDVWNAVQSELHPGVFVRFETQLERPVGYLNPGCFDPSVHLRTQGMHLSGHVKHPEFFTILASSGCVQMYLSRMRNHIIDSIDAIDVEQWLQSRTTSEEIQSISKALLVGSRGELSPDIRSAFQESGLVHLLAISGLHVGIVAGALAWILKWLPGWLCTRSIFLIVIIWFYALITGAGPSVVRASCLISLYMLSKIFMRPVSLKNILSFSIIILLIYQPAWIGDPGFQLTFAATYGIALLYSGFQSRLMWLPWPWLRDSLAISFAAQCATAPICAFWFNRIGLFSALSGLPLIPIASIALISGLVGLCLGSVPVLSCLILRIHGVIVGLMAWAAKTEAGIPFITIPVLTPRLGFVIAGLFLMGLMSFRDSRGYRTVISSALVSTLLISPVGMTSTPRELLEIWFLDVGNGDCTVVRLPDGRVIVIDAGGLLDSEFDIGEKIVVRTLRTLGIFHGDIAVVTHPHPDHQLGMKALIKAMKPRELWVVDSQVDQPSFREVIQTANSREVLVRSLENRSLFDVFPMNENNRSLVLAIRFDRFRVFLPGDAEHEAEGALLDYGPALKSTILKVGHHGSRSSCSPDFIRLLSPAVATIPCGRNNQFDHPHSEVLSDLKQSIPGIKLLRSDLHGMIHVATDGKTVQVEWSTLEPYR